MDEKADSIGIMKWHGVLEHANRTLRVVLAVVFFIACVALISTRLGFIEVALPDGEVAHIALFFLPVALGALLLGPIAGFSLGLFSGVVFYVHALLLPLDYFELVFVTPATSAQIRGHLASGIDLGEAVASANDQLSDGNSEGMFVTAWIGVLDYGSGHVEYVNAGHNPPLVFQGESWQWATERSGLPLGLFSGMPYESHFLDCAQGDKFVLYSDGVTEAMSVEGELYGEQHLESLLQGLESAHPRDLVEAIRADVATHAEGAEQSDDITVLVLEMGTCGDDRSNREG